MSEKKEVPKKKPAAEKPAPVSKIDQPTKAQADPRPKLCLTCAHHDPQNYGTMITAGGMEVAATGSYCTRLNWYINSELDMAVECKGHEIEADGIDLITIEKRINEVATVNKGRFEHIIDVLEIHQTELEKKATNDAPVYNIKNATFKK